MKDLEEFKAEAELEQQNKALVLRWLEESDKGNDEIWNEVCALDFIGRFPSNAEPITLEQHKQAAQTWKGAFPDFSHKINDIVVKGNKVVVRMTLHGTHSGEFMGIQRTGNRFEYSSTAIFRISQGKVAEFWADFDLMGLMQQLGAFGKESVAVFV
jgi:predicted ester cyclase